MQYTFRTSPPPTYISPTADEMKEVAAQVGLSAYSRDLVADLCNLAAGGTVSPPSSYRDQVRRQAEMALPAPDKDGEWKRPDGSRTKDRFTAIEDETAKSMRYHQNVCDFLGSLDLAAFPGTSPLEQAMAALKLLSKQQGGSGGGQGGEPLPIFQENANPEKTAESLNDLMDEVESLSQDELDMLDPEGKKHPVDTSDGQRQGSESLQKLAVAEDLADANKRAMLEVSRTLDDISKLHLRKQEDLEVDPAGEEVRQRPIRHLGELPKIAKSEWATRQQAPAYFLYKAVSGQLPVRERVTRIIRKQAVYILVDGSGSMSGRKHFKASGVVMNRLKAVIAGDAEVWVAVFDATLSKAQHAATPEQARELIKQFTNGNFRGGGTDIAAAVRAAHKDIEVMIQSGAALYRPEIVVLTDDDTSTSALKPAEIAGTRVHGFAIESKNPTLLKLAQATGGYGVENF